MKTKLEILGEEFTYETGHEPTQMLMKCRTRRVAPAWVWIFCMQECVYYISQHGPGTPEYTGTVQDWQLEVPAWKKEIILRHVCTEYAQLVKVKKADNDDSWTLDLD